MAQAWRFALCAAVVAAASAPDCSSLACDAGEEATLMATALLQADMSVHGRLSAVTRVRQDPPDETEDPRNENEHAGRVAEGVYFQHIPKCAGSSFSLDAESIVMASGQAFDASEECFYTAAEGVRVLSVLREPRSHLASMFRYCVGTNKWDNYDHEMNAQGDEMGRIPVEIDEDEMTALFEEWLHAWVGVLESSTAPEVSYTGIRTPFAGTRPEGSTYNCYMPLSLQVHRFTCLDVDQWSAEQRQADDESVLNQALDNMHAAWLIGVQEEYEASVCLLHYRVTGGVPEGCNCDSSSEVPTISINDNDGTVRPRMTEEIVALIDQLTRNDRVLYEAAVQRFRADVAAAEEALGVRFLCDDDSS